MNDYLQKKIKEAPVLDIQDQQIAAAYRGAVKNLLEINTVACPMEQYNKTGLLSKEPGLMIRAGGGYPTPWTRDASINTWNAACFLEPEVAKNTLYAVCERQDGKLCFQLDNQGWDKVVWALGAWQYYLATGDIAFLKDAFETVETSVSILEKTQFDQNYGMFTGGSFFNDGIVGYPKDLHEEGNPSSFVGDHPAVARVMTLSTNCLYYEAYCILKKMDQILTGGTQAAVYQKRADALKEAINRCLWKEEKGRYSYILYPDGRVDDSQEGSGNSFAILFDVCNKKQAEKILKNFVQSKNGIVSIWPPFPEISSIEKPLRHNNIIWPFINGFFVTAAAKYGFSKIVGSEIRKIAGLVAGSDGIFYEIYNAETGLPDGGWQCGRQWDSVIHQTWSATGFIRMLVYAVFGITLKEDGIAFHPCLPEGFGTVSLNGIRFREVEMDLKLHGEGSRLDKILINGEAESFLSFSKPGKYQVEMWMA